MTSLSPSAESELSPPHLCLKLRIIPLTSMEEDSLELTKLQKNIAANVFGVYKFGTPRVPEVGIPF